MKRITKYLLFLVVGLTFFLSLVGCKTKVKKTTTTTTTPTTVTPTTTKEKVGTLDNPLTVNEALTLGNKLPKGAISNETYYIQGYVWGGCNPDDAKHFLYYDNASIYVDGLASADDHSYGTNFGLPVPFEAYEFVTYLCRLKNESVGGSIIVDAKLISHEKKVFSLGVYVNGIGTSQFFGFKYNDSAYYGDIMPSLYVGTDVKLESIVPEGYEFVGWYGLNDLLISYDNKLEFVFEKDTYIHMKWKPINSSATYTLTLVNDDPNGGTIDTPYTNQAFDAGTSVTIEASAKTGYSFDGWYNGTSFVSSSSQYTFAIYDNLTLTAKWVANSITPTTYTLTTVNDNPAGGSITSYTNESFEANSSVTLTATANTGYEFDGWYNGSSLVESNPTYTFSINSNLILTAKWRTTTPQSTYTLSTINDNSNAGTITSYTNETFDANEEVELTAEAATGYRFDGWYSGTNMVSPETTYKFNINSNLTLTAKWIKTYTLTTSNDNTSAGTITEYTNKEYDENTSITISVSVNKNGVFSFNGWYDVDLDEYVSTPDEESYTFTITKNTHLKATWICYTLTTKACFNTGNDIPDEEDYFMAGTFTSFNEEKFSVGLKIYLTATVKDHCATWVGWYLKEDDEYTLVSENKNFDYEMPRANVTLVAKYLLYKLVPGQTNVIEYGFYPQSAVAETETELLARLNSQTGTLPTEGNNGDWTDYGYRPKNQTESFMWYKDIYDSTTDAKYRGVYFVKYRPDSMTSTPGTSTTNAEQYKNGYLIEHVYWFKFEPVIWDIVTEKENTHDKVLVARFILDAQNWYENTSERHSTDGLTTIYPNNYEASSIKAFLNDTFYYTVFDVYRHRNNCINVTDNSAASTGHTTNEYALEGDSYTDKVYLMSYKEAKDYVDGTSFEKSMATDYAKCQGINVATGTGSSSGYSVYWLRSPSTNASNAKYGSSSGLANNATSVTHVYGVRPVVNMFL